MARILMLLIGVLFSSLYAEHPSMIEGVARRDFCEARLKQLDDEIHWYLNFLEKKNAEDFKNYPDNKDFNEKEKQRIQELKTQLPELHAEFLELRKCFSDVLKDNVADPNYAFAMQSKHDLEFTEEYIRCVEKWLFPYSWRELYAEDHEEKVQVQK